LWQGWSWRSEICLWLRSNPRGGMNEAKEVGCAWDYG